MHFFQFDSFGFADEPDDKPNGNNRKERVKPVGKPESEPGQQNRECHRDEKVDNPLRQDWQDFSGETGTRIRDRIPIPSILSQNR